MYQGNREFLDDTVVEIVLQEVVAKSPTKAISAILMLVGQRLATLVSSTNTGGLLLSNILMDVFEQ